MATLIPHNGNRYLMPVEVIRRVEAAFPYVETTPEGARARVLEWMSQLAFVAPEGRDADFGEELARLEAAQDDALYLCFGDELDDAALVSVLMVPGQPLYVDPPEQAQDRKTAALIARCAQALGYVVARVDRRDTRAERRENAGERRKRLDERRKTMEERRGTPFCRRAQERRLGA